MGVVFQCSEEMVERLQKEEEAKELLRRCHMVMRSLVQDGRVSAEDLAQELALKLLQMGQEGRNGLKNEIWLKQVARNLRNDHFRMLATLRRGGGMYHEPLDEEIADQDQSSPHDLVEAKMDAESFYDLLRPDLSHKEQQLFDLRRQHPEAPYAWLAERLGSSEQAARMMWSRILEKTEAVRSMWWYGHAEKFRANPNFRSASSLLSHSADAYEGVAHFFIARRFNAIIDPWSVGEQNIPVRERLELADAAAWHGRW